MAYEILGKLGEGGMGCVFKARDPQGRIIALKMMSNKVSYMPEYRQLFRQEVQTLQLLKHPSVVRIMGEPYSDSSGNFFLPMEYIEGKTVEQAINDRGRFTPTEAVDYMLAILDAMQYVHAQKRIHRDIKPSNIMIRPDGRVCVIDFGIAKDARFSTGKTVGHIIGTDGYMSPEQTIGNNIDHRTDIYSLGCVFFYLLTGRNAIPAGKSDYEVIQNILKCIPDLPSKIYSDIPSALDDVFLKAVDKNMTKRYQSAAEFRQAIERAMGTELPQVTVGRGKENDIVIEHDDVSRRHLIIQGITEPNSLGENYSVKVIDVGSTNGTGFNGRFLRGDSASFEYGGTTNFPEIMLAGRSELSIDWKQVMRLLRERGWNPGTKMMSDIEPTKPKPEPKIDITTPKPAHSSFDTNFLLVILFIIIIILVIALCANT